MYFIVFDCLTPFSKAQKTGMRAEMRSGTYTTACEATCFESTLHRTLCKLRWMQNRAEETKWGFLWKRWLWNEATWLGLVLAGSLRSCSLLPLSSVFTVSPPPWRFLLQWLLWLLVLCCFSLPLTYNFFVSKPFVLFTFKRGIDLVFRPGARREEGTAFRINCFQLKSICHQIFKISPLFICL